MSMQRAPLVAALLAFALTAALGPAAWAASTPQVDLAINNQAFQPTSLTIPAGEQVKIVVDNQDAIPAEFESYDFNREKVVPGHSRVSVYVGPLEPGTYSFFNDFHPASKGKLIVR